MKKNITITTCDRCGKKVAFKYDNLVYIFIMKYSLSKPYPDKNLDLCETCQDELENWFLMLDNL